MMRIDANSWYYSREHGQLCQVVEVQTPWGETTCRVWLPGRDSVVRVPASRLKSLEIAGTGSPDDIAYVAAAALVADALTKDVLLAPIEASFILPPDQIRALFRAIADDAFAACRKTIEQIGLPEVRNHHLNLLAEEERAFQEQLAYMAQIYPDMVPLLTIRVERTA